MQVSLHSLGKHGHSKIASNRNLLDDWRPCCRSLTYSRSDIGRPFTWKATSMIEPAITPHDLSDSKGPAPIGLNFS
eukprot:3252503-Amphidinium_carterae.1